MVEPSSQDIYVAQNEHGLIKIGRAMWIAERIRGLRRSERCELHLVTVLANSGHREEEFHIRLDKHRLHGEWFNGNKTARSAVERVMKIKGVTWPIKHDPTGAFLWHHYMLRVRLVEAVKRDIYRHYTTLRGSQGPHWAHDLGIYASMERARKELRLDGRSGEQPSTHGIIERPPIPAYTSDVAAALTIWPAEVRPSEWTGTAMECCIEGLKAYRAGIPEVPRLARTKAG